MLFNISTLNLLLRMSVGRRRLIFHKVVHTTMLKFSIFKSVDKIAIEFQNRERLVMKQHE